MTSEQRKWQFDMAIRLMEEVVADILDEAHNDGKTPLRPWDVYHMSPLWLESHGSQLVTLVGKRLESKGLIRNSGSNTQPLWSPANVDPSWTSGQTEEEEASVSPTLPGPEHERPGC